jgi:hypothetical protein
MKPRSTRNRASARTRYRLAKPHLWAGLDHAFHYDPDLPRAREVYEVIVRLLSNQLNDGRNRHRMARSSLGHLPRYPAPICAGMTRN